MANIYIYNPTCDMAVENGTLSYMPPATLRKFEEDITPLMSFLASKNDIVVSNSTEHESFCDFWMHLGFEQPQYINWSQTEQLKGNYKITPWGWSPVIIHKLNRFINNGYHFNIDSTRNLFSRQTSVDIVTQLNAQSAPEDEFIFIPNIPFKISKVDSILQLIKDYQNGIVVKTLFSSSGRGLLFLKTQKEFYENLPWIESKIKSHGYLVAEPLYQKIQDASMQFIIEGDSYRFLGLNFFDSDSKGKFQKEYIRIPNKIIPFLPNDSGWIEKTAQRLIDAMKAIKLHEMYNGPVGIDTLFLKNTNGKIRFHPIIEANLRCNMGLINIHIKRRIHEESYGTWQIESFKKGEAKKFFYQQIKAHPIEIKNGLIIKGFIPLSPFSSNQQFAAWGMITANV